MQAAKFTIFTASELAAIEKNVASVFSQWRKKWFLQPEGLPSTLAAKNIHDTPAPLSEKNSHQKKMSRRDADDIAQLYFLPKAIQHCYQSATDDQSPASIKNIVEHPIKAIFTSKILNDLLVDFFPAAGSSNGAVPDQYQDKSPDFDETILPDYKGSGTVIVAIAYQDFFIQIGLSQSIARRLSGRRIPNQERTKLASKKLAIGRETIKLQVTAGEIELRLSELLSLRPGHVLRLAQTTKQPFLLETVDTRVAICFAGLGQRDGYKTVQLIDQ